MQIKVLIESVKSEYPLDGIYVVDDDHRVWYIRKNKFLYSCELKPAEKFDPTGVLRPESTRVWDEVNNRWIESGFFHDGMLAGVYVEGDYPIVHVHGGNKKEIEKFVQNVPKALRKLDLLLRKTIKNYKDKWESVDNPDYKGKLVDLFVYNFTSGQMIEIEEFRNASFVVGINTDHFYELAWYWTSDAGEIPIAKYIGGKYDFDYFYEGNEIEVKIT